MGIIEEKIFCKGFQDSDVKLGAAAYNLIKVTDVYRGIHAIRNTMKFGTMSTAHF